MELLLSPAVLLTLAAVYAIGSSLIRRRPAIRRRALVRFAGSVDLPGPDQQLWPHVEAALTRRNVAVDVGAQAGIAVAAVLALLSGTPEVVTGGREAAHNGLWATGVDTVAPAELVNVGTVLAVIVGLTALAVGEVTGRRLLDLPQAAGSSLELAWSDALRARVLRDVVTAPLAIGVYACFALLVAASAGVGDPAIANGLVGLIGLGAIGLVVIAGVSAASRPQRHFRQRLWPGDGASSPKVSPAEPTGGPR